MSTNRTSIAQRLISLLTGGILACALLVPAAPAHGAAARTSDLSASEALRQGQRIYREGILPSGETLQAVVKGDISVPGTSFTCVSCHLRSGLGSVEGGVITPPTNGENLYKPFQILYKGIEQNPRLFPIPPRRPAYTDASLSEAIQGGVDSSGRVMNDVMPRYLLEKEDMALLISYLKSLSAEVSPGVADTSLRFATVITDDVSPADRKAMLDSLQKLVDLKNGQVKFFKTQAGSRSRLMAENMMSSRELAMRTLSLSTWDLKGPPKTWRSQLEEYYRNDPVFALIGGMTGGEWRPIHQFSEDHRIPCLFPATDFPVISQTDWYTLYLSKGYFQEGEAAARYLLRMEGQLKGKGIVQIVRDSREGRALSSGFIETWRELGQGEPVTITLKAGDDTAGIIEQQVLSQGKPAAVILWDGAAAVPALEKLANHGNKPDMAIVSSGYLGKSIWALKDPVRDFTYLTYPYRLPPRPSQPAQNESKPAMGKKVFSADVTKVDNQTYAIKEVLSMALMNMKGSYYRDNFLDVIDMFMDQEMPLYERLSFGPGQRYASKGCYMVQLAKGETHELIRKSDWVIH